MKKSVKSTYSDIRCAIAFIMRGERLNKHIITEAALTATKILYGKAVVLGSHGRQPVSPARPSVQNETAQLAQQFGFKQRKQPFPFR